MSNADRLRDIRLHLERVRVDLDRLIDRNADIRKYLLDRRLIVRKMPAQSERKPDRKTGT